MDGEYCHPQQDFIERIRRDLDVRAGYRGVADSEGGFALREPRVAYRADLGGEIEVLNGENSLSWRSTC